MGPLSSGRLERARLRRALTERDGRAIGAVFVAACGVTLLGAGGIALREAELAVCLLALGVMSILGAYTLAAPFMQRSNKPGWILPLVTHLFFWVTLAAGLVIVVNGRVPFVGDVLAKTPGQNVATDLGNALLGGLIVAAVLIVIEMVQRRREEHQAEVRQRESERSTMLLLLGLERDLSRVDLSDRDLSWFSLRRRTMQRARMRRCCLFRANLEHCDLTRAEFDDADLTNVFMADAVLEEAMLHRATLDSAHLQRANLTNAALYGSSMRRAKLTAAQLAGADLRAVDLRDADLTDADLSGATFDSDTLFPEGWDPVREAMVQSETTPDRFITTPTGASCCGADHEDEMVAWTSQQEEAARTFRDTLDKRVHTPAG